MLYLKWLKMFFCWYVLKFLFIDVMLLYLNGRYRIVIRTKYTYEKTGNCLSVYHLVRKMYVILTNKTVLDF